MSENVSGWTFTDVKKGPWNQNANYWGCAKASWFGWDWPGAASISTTLHGKGKAILEFGNCIGIGRDRGTGVAGVALATPRFLNLLYKFF